MRKNQQMMTYRFIVQWEGIASTLMGGGAHLWRLCTSEEACMVGETLGLVVPNADALTIAAVALTPNKWRIVVTHSRYSGG